MTSLNRSYKIQTLAKDLKLRPSDKPVETILAFCEQRVRRLLKEFSRCQRPSELLENSRRHITDAS